jgi:hypothetical protein
VATLHSGNVYFRNALTEVCTYDHPLDEHYRSYYLRARDEKMATIEIGVKVMEAQREKGRTMQQQLIASQMAAEVGMITLSPQGLDQPGPNSDTSTSTAVTAGIGGGGEAAPPLSDGFAAGGAGVASDDSEAWENLGRRFEAREDTTEASVPFASASGAAAPQHRQLASASAVFAAASAGQTWKNKAAPREMWKDRASAAAQRPRPMRYRRAGGAADASSASHVIASSEMGVVEGDDFGAPPGSSALGYAFTATAGGGLVVGERGHLVGDKEEGLLGKPPPLASSSSATASTTSAVRWQQHCVGLDAVTAAALDVLSPDDTEALLAAVPSHANPDNAQRNETTTTTKRTVEGETPIVSTAGARVDGADGASSTMKPTAAQVAAYAEWLGMDVGADKHLFYIAEWALTAPLPDGWVEETNPIPGEDDGKAVVYRNIASGVRTYEHPSDEQYRAYYRSMEAGRCTSCIQLTHSVKAPCVPVLEPITWKTGFEN